MNPVPNAVKYSFPDRLVPPALKVDFIDGTLKFICASNVWNSGTKPFPKLASQK